MPKVIAPLHSQSASGQLAKDIVFVDTKRGPVVRSYAIPANPRSASQQGQRAFFGGLAKLFVTLAQADQDAWTALATASNYDERNAFAKANLDRFSNGQTGLAHVPTIDTGADPPTDLVSNNLTNEGNIWSLQFSNGTPSGTEFGVAIMAVPTGDAAPTKPTKANLLALIEHDVANTMTFDHDDGGSLRDYYVQSLGEDAKVGAIVQVVAV